MSRVDRIAAICGIFWLILNIDACFTWFINYNLIRYFGNLLIFFASIVLYGHHGIVASKQRNILSVSIIVLTLYFVFTKVNIFHVFRYFPLICVVYWRSSVLSQMYYYFRRFVIFYSILSIFVEILVVTRVWVYLPHVILPPQDFIQEDAGLVNYYYGLFCIPASDTSLSFYRACGPLREGGHWIFFIGFVYFAEKALKGKRNIWLIICGVLTLSPNFILIFLLTEFYCAVAKKKFFKPLLSVVGVFGVIVVLFIFAPQSIKDDIIGIFYERILEKSLQSVEDDGWMALLDGRATEESFMLYNSFLHSGSHTKLFGERYFDPEGVMSDFRYLYIFVGYIGTALIAWCTLAFSFVRVRNMFNICVFTIALAVFLQRAWMYTDIYIWVMILLITNEQFINYNKQKLCLSH